MPRGVYLKPDFRWYEVLSKRMLDVVRRFSGQVEYYSIDEFFADVPSGHDPYRWAVRVRDEVKRVCGVPATIG